MHAVEALDDPQREVRSLGLAASGRVCAVSVKVTSIRY
jgi:hypothetical protein